MRVLLVCLLLVSVAAAQNPAADACRDQGGPEPGCKTLESGTNAMAWWCRHAGGPEDQCSQLDGRVVSSEKVDAYVQGPVAAGFAEMRERERGLPLQDTFWLSSHNSFNSAWYEPTFTQQDPNHIYSMYDQLRMEARGLELDIHWLPQPDQGGFAPMVCHGRGSDQAHGGCTRDRHLAAVLPEIKAWMDDNPDEVLMIDIQDELQFQGEDEANAHNVAAQVFIDIFGELIITPTQTNTTCEVPTSLSRDDLQALGRVLLVSDCGPGDTWTSLVHGKDNWVQQSMPLADCVWDEATYATQWTRIWEDSTFVGEWAETTGAAGEVEPIRLEDIPMIVGCGIHMISLDQTAPDDGRLEAFLGAWQNRTPPPVIVPEPAPEPAPQNTTVECADGSVAANASMCPEPPQEKASPAPGLLAPLLLAAVGRRGRPQSASSPTTHR